MLTIPAKLEPGRLYLRTNPGPGSSEIIYSMNTDGSGLAQLLALPPEYNSATLSPDGTRIAFVDCTEDIQASKRNLAGSLYIGLMNIDGTGIERLTGGKDVADIGPEWSSDGKQIAFISARLIGVDIYLVSDMGGKVTPVTSDFLNTQTSVVKGCLSWSPDGMRIAYSGMDVSKTAPQPTSIFTVNVDSTHQTNLTPGRDLGWPVCPRWSPDGSRIAFASGKDIYVMHADGSALTIVSSSASSILSLIWSPDSQHILWSDDNINVINVDGSGLHQLSTNTPSYALLRIIKD